MNPEFLSQGKALDEFLNPARIVVGSPDVPSGELVAALYEGLEGPVIMTDPTSAEMVKYASNTFLATKISFVNAIAAMCEAFDGVVDDVVAGMTLDPRIGSAFFVPGPGFGGSCLPKDTTALLNAGRAAGYDNPVLDAVLRVNDQQLDRIERRVTTGLPPDGVIALWGLTFKAGTDDMRDSPAAELGRRFVANGYTVQCYDPQARNGLEGTIRLPTALDAATGADVLVIATEWPEFVGVDLAAVAGVMRGKRVVDARNILDGDAARANGLAYAGIGRT